MLNTFEQDACYKISYIYKRKFNCNPLALARPSASSALRMKFLMVKLMLFLC
jgi:hypothetical protein